MTALLLAAALAQPGTRPLPAHHWLVSGTEQRAEGAWELAEQTLQAGARAHPEERALWNELGTTRAWLGDHRGALEAYQVALALAPDDATAHAGRLRVLWWSGRRDRALREARTLQRAFPGQDELAGLARDIEEDRPRTLTLVAGARHGALDGARPLGGLRASARHRHGTTHAAVERAQPVAPGQPAAASLAVSAGHAVPVHDHLVVDLGGRAWWGEELTPAAALRVTTPLGALAPWGQLLAGPRLAVVEGGVRVGRRAWAQLGLTHALGGADRTESTSGSAAVGWQGDGLQLQLDGSLGRFEAGMLPGVSTSASLPLGPRQRVGVEIRHLAGFLQRTDGVLTWSVSF